MNDQGGKTNQRKRSPSPRRRKRRFHLKTRRTKNANEIKARKPRSTDHQVVGRGLVQDQMNAMIVDHGNEMKVQTVNSPRETHLQNGTLMIRIAKDPKGTRLQDETLIAKGDDTKVAMTTKERDETELHKKGNVEEKKITGKETETVVKRNKMAFEVIADF